MTLNLGLRAWKLKVGQIMRRLVLDLAIVKKETATPLADQANLRMVEALPDLRALLCHASNYSVEMRY